jgi:hypothetical protein
MGCGYAVTLTTTVRGPGQTGGLRGLCLSAWAEIGKCLEIRQRQQRLPGKNKTKQSANFENLNLA